MLSNSTLLIGQSGNEECQPDLNVVEVARMRNLSDTIMDEWPIKADATVVLVSLKSTNFMLKTKTGLRHEGPLSQGSILWIEDGSDTAACFNGAYDFVLITLKTSLSLRAAQGVKFITNGVLLRDRLIEQLGRTLEGANCEAVGSHYEAAVAKVIALRAIAIAGHSTRACPLPVWRLRRVREFVEARLDTQITLADMARVAGLSRMHFAAQIRAATGVKAHDFVLIRRIERAKEMMRDSDTPLVQIALDVGFQAQSHFTTVFKRLTGETPAAWRLQERSLRATFASPPSAAQRSGA